MLPITVEQSQGLVNLPEQEKENLADPVPCPSCAEPVTLHGFFATSVKTGWFLYHCETITEEDARKFDLSSDPYHCLSRTFDHQCQNSDTQCQILKDLSCLSNDINIQENDLS